ncbi:histidine kinase dimerization/phospho-acceptor domain-containing protein [Sphingomonas qomolangmaensis]|uniref:histidine kinase n=1 Tax=Sphingomonas qomolangmaensis TaxID=2918765 RepID=A0ABY5LD26_9SPHN|nr:histidine kinase dimerization/phospho-acceptor domain-containing protein [Sphingomonas qomolangmaensis]UUL83689.1 sensor histidine kinase [Sphingomonas qomolangmaensis]
MRFDDTLDTVLAADLSSAFEQQSVYRQLVDLIGRGRVPAEDRAIETLAALIPQVPLAVRSASARGLAFARPPAALVALMARDELSVAAPVLRTAMLDDGEWTALLPALAPSGRAILRHRRDLSSSVLRALESFGPSDYVLEDGREVAAVPAVADQPLAPVADAIAPEPDPVSQDQVTPRSDPVVAGPFSSFGAVALTIPIVADAVRDAETRGDTPIESTAAPEGPFEIADVVARIDAFRERRERSAPAASPRLPDAAAVDRFRFETDAKGVIGWADGIGRAPLLGRSLMLAGQVGAASIDASAAGAFRQRARFRDARLTIDGEGLAAGGWLISGVPVFDPASGRFTGYRGTARRPRAGETAAPPKHERNARPDAFRQLVHELRTPTNAIVGFSEMIEMQILGPVADPYRDRAQAIRRHARDLLGAIDDLDLAARIETDALTLRPEPVSLRAVIGSVVDDLLPLCELRGATIAIPSRDAAVQGDRHAIERLLGRLVATLLSATRAGEVVAMELTAGDDGEIELAVARPLALAIDPVMAVDEIEDDSTLDAAPLGTGFAIRLVGNLARELGGSLAIDEQQLLLKLPAATPVSAQRASKL